jgi:methionyl-tRNA formyltransferase
MTVAGAPQTVVIATPHPRYDALERRVRELLSKHRVVRIRTQPELTLEAMDRLRPRFVFLPHWSWRIPESVHQRFECVIFHMTDLPYGRGGSPLQNLILRGHSETMLSALRCAADLDAGPIYMKRPLSLAGTAEEILRRAGKLMEDMIAAIARQQPVPLPQEEDPPVRFTRRGPADGDIRLASSIEQIYDFVRMLDAEGYPPAFLDIGDLHLEFSAARLEAGLVEAKVRIRKRKP